MDKITEKVYNKSLERFKNSFKNQDRKMEVIYLVYARPRYDKEAKATTYIVRGDKERDKLIEKLKVEGFLVDWEKLKNKSLEDIFDEDIAFTKMIKSLARRISCELCLYGKEIIVNDDGEKITLRKKGSEDYIACIVY